MTVRATFAERWAQAVAARGPHPFLVYLGADGRTTTWTYASFDDVVDRTAARLAAGGVGPGSAVHLVLRNSPSFVATWLAVARLGAWMVPSDPEGTPAELAEHLRRTRPVVGVCSSERAAVYREAVELAAASDLEVVAVDEDDPEPAALMGPAATTLNLGGRLPASEVQRSSSRPGPHDRLAVLFTSGTTSAPKGVEVTQAGYAFTGDVMASAAALGPEDRQMVVLPLFHANAQYYSFASAISAGASVALVHRFSASAFLAQAAALQATCASLFAAPIRMIMARGGTPVEGLRLRHCWYAQNLTADQHAQLSRLLGCRPRQLYGMTETLPAVITDRPLAPRPDAMGFPTLGCDVRVVDGELQVRGVPGETLFAGYLDDPVTTEACVERLPDGSVWFTTGDRALIDPQDGRLVFAGRRSDVLKVAGENVSTVEVEAVLAEHPAVLEAAVVGRPDPVRDEVPVAFVVLAPDAADHAGADELQAHVAERLAKAKRPREIHLVEELPRTSVGKIRKFLLPGGHR
jgi:crotonobetaine/carnitine-CoA ligase